MNDASPDGQDPTPRDIETGSNLTRSQFLIWAGQQMSPGLPIYNMGWRFRFGSDVAPDRFDRAFKALVEANDTLRMTFTVENDVPRFSVQETAAGDHVTHSVDAAAGQACVDEMIRRPFDLSTETFRSALLQIEGSGWEWVIVQHHIVTDAASASVLLAKLSDEYERLAHPSPEPVEPLPAFSTWAERDGRETRPEDEAYWRGTLDQIPAPQPLYAATNAHETARTTALNIPLSAAQMRKLRAATESARFAALTPDQTRFNLLATALFGWLYRITDEDSVALGVTTHGRTTLNARATAGLFMEILPLHCHVAPQDSLADLHDHVSGRAMELMMHASPGASSAASHAKFNVVLNYLRTSFGTFAGTPVEAQWLEHAHFDPAHALWVDVLGSQTEDAVTLRLRFNAGLFSDESMDRAARQLLRMLDSVLDTPDQAVTECPVADDTDRSVALTKVDPWHGAATPTDVCAAFAAHVAASPDAVSVHEAANAVTRADLDRRANQIAHALSNKGVTPGDRVGVFLTRGASLIAAVLAVLRAGAAYVPLDPLQPIGRLKSIADHAGLAATVTEQALQDHWPELADRIVVETTQDMPVAFSGPAPDAGADAYVIFTSGSTGTPKGVRISRGSLARYAAFAARTYGGDAPRTWALHSAIGFDLTVTSIFAPLVSGGVIRAYREELGTTDLSVLTVFAEDAVDIVKLTPAHLALVTRQQISTRRIKTLVLGGENLTTQLARAAVDGLGFGVTLYNEYGPTEATVGCMVHVFEKESETGASVPIGQAATDTAIYILDRSGQPVPDDVRGELCVAGPDRLALGYLNMAPETDGSFVENPFVAGTLMYRTGDLAHIDARGVIHYHGRRDDQIKIGSVRVELGEIRAAVLSYPNVTDCVVTAGQDQTAAVTQCVTCGLGSDHPDADIDDTGTCRLCRDFEGYRERAQGYFRTMDDLRAIINGAQQSEGDYDCLMLLSGGKDSSYALGQLAALTPRVLAVTLDNGFVSEQAIANIERVCSALGVDHRFISTPYMNEIFADSLERYANVCNGCFKVIYTLGMQLAQKEGIGIVVTGLSRGQLFETRLAPELFGAAGVSAEEIDRNVIEARRFYHRVPDATAQRLNKGFFDDETVFDRIQFVDFYRYCDVSVAEMYEYLDEKVPWLRPSDTGRSTNCLINDLGIYVHKQRRGYHNYALPYSWDVRTGHKDRDAALAELDDDIDVPRMHEIMKEIGYTPAQGGDSTEAQLSCYIVATGEIDAAALRHHLSQYLPRPLIPGAIHLVPNIPLTPNGKVDQPALAKISRTVRAASSGASQAPANETEAVLLDIWRTVLDRDDFGPKDNFFDFGGDSVHAISIASRASRAGLPVTALAILTRQTVAGVAQEISTAAPAARMPSKRATLDRKSMDRLGALFGTKRGD